MKVSVAPNTPAMKVLPPLYPAVLYVGDSLRTTKDAVVGPFGGRHSIVFVDESLWMFRFVKF